MKLVLNRIVVFLLSFYTMSLFATDDGFLYKCDPFWGSDKGNVFPGASVPWGMVKLSPDVKTDGTPTSGYRDRDNIVGFSHTHTSGTGGSPRYGNILVIPQHDSLDIVGYRVYDKQNESAYPGYYTVTLKHETTLTKAELTASEKVGHHRYSFWKRYDPSTEVHPYFVIDVSNVTRKISQGKPSTYCTAGKVSVIDQFRIEGQAECQGGWGGKNPYTIYFSILFDKPFETHGVFHNGNAFSDKDSFDFVLSGETEERFGAFVSFNANPHEYVNCKVGISYKSQEQAYRNLLGEIETSFETACKNASDKWAGKFSKINVKGDNIAAQKMFYSAMRNSMLMPTDVTGEVLGWDANIPHFWDIYCLWDVFRTGMPLYTLIYPETQRRIIQSLLDIYDKKGYLPDAWVAGDYASIQGGSNADVVLADAVVKQLGGFDNKKALEATLKNAEIQSSTPEISGRFSDDYTKYGFVRSETYKGSVSRSLEYAYNDFCIAQIAKANENREVYDKYISRSQNIFRLFHPEHNMFWAKDSLFQWKEGFSPVSTHSDSWNDPYFYEGGSIVYSTYVPHDMAGLIQRHGGKESFCRYLDKIFDEGLYDIENEPEFLLPYLYNYSGNYASTAKRLNEIVKTKFTLGRNGLPGQDDAGAMSSWYIFTSMGFFPVAGQDVYLLGTPLFEEVLIQLENNKPFKIKAIDLNEKNIYITSASINGKPLNQSWFRHSDIKNGGELELRMGENPSGWGNEILPPSLTK